MERDKAWEYVTVTVPTPQQKDILTISDVLTTEINRVAKYGWRLQSTTLLPMSADIHSPSTWVLVFERPAGGSDSE